MQNLWRELRPGPKVPDIVYAIIEIPKGSRNKYEYNKENGVIVLDRVLFSSLHYPGDYGLIPRTFYDDGDPLDILLMTNEPTFPGCIIQARPIGVFRMLDRGVSDDKILAVPATDPLFAEYHDLSRRAPALPARSGALLRGLQGPRRRAHQARGLGRRSHGQERDLPGDQDVR